MGILDYPAHIRPLTEANLNRLMSHARHGMVILSANRSDIRSENPSQDMSDEYSRYLRINNLEDNEENAEAWLKKRNKTADEQLLNDIKSAGFAFSKVFGGYHEKGTDPSKNSYEPSYVVYNHAPSSSNDYRNFKDLLNFALKMCEKYKQDCVYVQKPGTPPPPPEYIKADGSVDMSFSGKFKLNRDEEEFFTTAKRERSNPQRFTAEGVERLPKQPAKDPSKAIFEGVFRAAPPATYYERMKRRKLGEVFLDA